MLRGPTAHALIVAALMLSGCASLADGPSPAASSPSSSPSPTPFVMDWTPGSWWSYRATVGNATFDLALIVHEAHSDGFRLGTNLSVGFFGLPFNGNVTPQFNPRIGPDVWPLFQFPLADGKEWAYELFGYQARTIARETTLEVPGFGERQGFRLESKSFGAVFARYDYSPEAGWFTRLELIEPTDGSTVLLAELTAFGHDWDQAYYVEQTIRSVRVDYPALPAAFDVRVPEGYLQARATLTAQVSMGALTATLRDEDGRTLARAETFARGADVDRASARPAGGATWRLDHRGAGAGFVFLEITGVSATGPLAAPPTDGPRVDLAALLQSTFPA